MAARHKVKKATGGITTNGGYTANAGGNPEVIKEAEEKKKGGKVMGKMQGEMSRHRLDRPGRKTGGRVGADRSPLSSANKTGSAPAEPKEQTGGMSD
jgi:hypothetical protein